MSELKSHLYVALDAQLLTTDQFRELYDVGTTTERLIGGFMKYLAASRLKGSKLK